jgi:hypothetical protein
MYASDGTGLMKVGWELRSRCVALRCVALRCVRVQFVVTPQLAPRGRVGVKEWNGMPDCVLRCCWHRRRPLLLQHHQQQGDDDDVAHASIIERNGERLDAVTI